MLALLDTIELPLGTARAYVDPKRWQKVKEIYSSALARKPHQRVAFLADACGNDSELLRDVEALLARSTAASNAATATLLNEPSVTPSPCSLETGQTLGPYRIESLLGAGGMGRVYLAVDTRLGRKVAIKISSEQFSGRFEREARAISALNHPHICTLYDVGSLPSGFSYLVTELVEGETLRDWLKHAPSPERCIEVARQVLEALRAAHGAGIVHRDLKPANIMVRFDGYVKVLDFGLAKRYEIAEQGTTADLSLPGQFVGTVAYMSPEQIQGHGIGPASDLFVFGIILHEMLNGEHPWPHKAAPVDTLHAILHDDPPPICAAAAARWAPIVEKLLRKDPTQRYASASEVLDSLAAGATSQSDPKPDTRPPTRLIVLPFRILRSHEASDFLAFSLPDAITNSLTAIDSLVVRSTMAASRFVKSPELDVAEIGKKFQVDEILTGTLLSDGEILRVSTQLIEAPSGTIRWSHTSRASLRDIFQLQDDLVDRVVQSLTLSVTPHERKALKRDVPASAISYELFLRANQLALSRYDTENLLLARDLYLRSVEEDPNHAPAWAALGRVFRLIGKYAAGDLKENLTSADEAFQKAFALNPELALAHNYYTSLQTDLGRSIEAMERLLKRAKAHRHDPNLFAGLVHACRYCGLLEESIAADRRAHSLDAHVRTTGIFSHLNRCDFQRALDGCSNLGDWEVQAQCLIELGRGKDVAAVPSGLEHGRFQFELANGNFAASLAALEGSLSLPGPLLNDPEGFFWVGRSFALLNQPERALDFLSGSIDHGYGCLYTLSHYRGFAALRSHPRFADLIARAEALQARACKTFLENDGERLLEMKPEMKSAQRPPAPAPDLPPTSPALISIAVLPFVFLNDVEEHRALSLGFADALITTLGNLADIAVTPTSAILKLAGADPALVCRDFAVRYVLQGNVQKLGAQWRVSLQLFDAATRKIAFSEKHDFKLENVFDVQDEIGTRVVASLQSRFALASAKKARERYSSDPEAYGEFMAGLRESTSNFQATMESAVQHLTKAVELDPDFALAHATLSYTCANVYFLNPERAWIDKASEHCERALALDPNLPEGHLARAWILWSPEKNFQHAEAIAALERVLAAQPNMERAHNRMSAICAHIGRIKEANIAEQRARLCNPTTKARNHGYNFLYAGDFARAEEAAKAWLAEVPIWPHTASFAAECALMNDALDLAGERITAGFDILPGDPMLLSLQSAWHAYRGEKRAALDCVHASLESPQPFIHIHHAYHQFAGVYATLGDSSKAMVWLQRAAETGLPCACYFRVDPHLANLRTLPAFETFLTSLERKYSAFKIERV